MQHFTYRPLQDLNCAHKTVLVRVDFNVPMGEGRITDDFRMQCSLKTLRRILDQGGKVVLASHLGRPEGKPNAALSLKPIAQHLQTLLPENPVIFIPETVGPLKDKALDALKAGEILVLENLRFSEKEEANDPRFAQELARGADAFVNDAFACSHRAHASLHAITRFLPSYAGLQLAEELNQLNTYLAEPQRPFMAIVGGAKLSTKLGLLEHLAPLVDVLAVTGAMAHTFLKAKGYQIGKSLLEEAYLPQAGALLEKFPHLLLPVDVVVVKEVRAGAAHSLKQVEALAADDIIVDAGPETVKILTQALEQVKTLVWNGALGITEMPPFDGATNAIAKVIAARTQNHGLISVAGGGDTLLALHNAGVLSSFTYASTAGGAFLEFLEGKPLPGIEMLSKPF